MPYQHSLPEDWKNRSIDSILKQVRKPVNVNCDQIYHEIGIRSHGKGLFYKEGKSGETLGNKAVFWIEPDCFIVNIVFAWEQAITKTTKSEVGMIASHRFPMYKPVSGKLDLDYLVYFFNTPYGKHLLGLASPGGAGRNKTLGQQEFRKLVIPLPPIDEQRKIAEILTTWDEAIRTTEKIIAALEKRKKGLMQRLLTGQVRFPGFTDAWKEVKLIQVVDLFFSNVDKIINENEKKVRLCNYMDVFANYYITNKIQFMDGSVNLNEFDKFLLKKDDVILTKDSETAEEIAESAVVIDEMDDVVCGYHLAILRPKDKQISGLFLMYLLHEESVHLQFVKRANGITRYGLTISSIENASLFLTSVSEQRKISDILLICDTEILKYKTTLIKLKQQKQGLMQRLLTGQVRVSV